MKTVVNGVVLTEEITEELNNLQQLGSAEAYSHGIEDAIDLLIEGRFAMNVKERVILDAIIALRYASKSFLKLVPPIEQEGDTNE